MSQVLKAGALYFAIVFGVGFVLGTIRVLWVVPRIGERTAEVFEMPIMFVVVFVAARWVARHIVDPTLLRLLAVGAVALGLAIVAEMAVIIFARQITVQEYLARRDPLSGVAFVAMLGLFAIMPVIVGQGRRGR
jgi:hypothetical protein